MRLKTSYIYPIKSAAGIAVDKSLVTSLGLEHDRLMMLIDDQNVFLSQRKHPKMSQIKTELLEDSIYVSAPDMSTIQVVKLNESGSPRGETVSVDVWGFPGSGFVAKPTVNQWLSEFLNQSVRLIQYDKEQLRKVDPQFSQPNDYVSFADGFPLLVASQASLDDLNSRLKKPVTMKSFRPNLVVDGDKPYAEDNWRKIRIGTIDFDVVSPCTRCVMTTVDPTTGVKREDGEPLKELRKYRKTSEGILFGMNLIPRSTGVVCKHDPVTIIESI